MTPREELLAQGQAADDVPHPELGPAVAAQADMKTHGAQCAVAGGPPGATPRERRTREYC
ncbi:hypothetical protein GCM10009858_27780 [Terrabacter carboxydivorans]|uniref:Uncharacterized protein n=1 Tax=Terrabacter carboxydivorans TaxID=619730 RepID=A0ABN3LU24_9MICO